MHQRVCLNVLVRITHFDKVIEPLINIKKEVTPKLHTNNPIIKHKAGLLKLVDESGLDALIDKSRRGANLKNRIDPVIEKAVVKYAIEFPAHGQHRASNELRRNGVFVSDSRVRSIWLINNLENFKKRLKSLEDKVAKEGIILTEAQVTALEKKKTDDEA